MGYNYHLSLKMDKLRHRVTSQCPWLIYESATRAAWTVVHYIILLCYLHSF